MLEKLQDRLKPKDWKGEDFRYKQIKLDGHRFTFIKTDGKLEAYGRTVEPDKEFSVKYPDIVEYDFWKTFQQMPDNSMVDGEIYLLGGTSSDITHHLVEQTGQLLFSAFAVPWWENINYFKESLWFAGSLLGRNLSEKLTPFYLYKPDLDTRAQMLDDASMLCIEGWVLKQENYCDWYKLKPTKTLDVVATDFQDGRGKYLGGVGALIGHCYIDGQWTNICKCSGMTDEIRWAIDEDKDLGRVFEVKYDCVGAKGKLRFPRFVRWRDDKSRAECIYRGVDL